MIVPSCSNPKCADPEEAGFVNLFGQMFCGECALQIQKENAKHALSK